MEPTGRYCRPARIRLPAADLPVALANPDRARQIAWATGLRAKTDDVDAKPLTELRQVMAPEIVPPASPGWTALKDLVLVAVHRQLTRHRTAHP